MNFTPIYNAATDIYSQLDRLNKNLEAWIGMVAVARATDPTAPPPAPVAIETAPAVEAQAVEAAVAVDAPTPDAATPASVAKRGRPKKMRYWREGSTGVLEEATDAPGVGWTEITKAKFDAMRESPAAVSTTAPTPVADDPFADEDEPAAAAVPTVTLDQVREIAFKVRDKFGNDLAKDLIGRYAVKLAEIPESRYAEFVAEAQAFLSSDL
jgi:hypothetical protein